MRTSRRLILLVALGSAVGLASAFAFEGTRTPDGISPASSVGVYPRGSFDTPIGPNSVMQGAPAIRNLTPNDAFRAAIQALRSGDAKNGIAWLEHAAADGHPIAQWKLGRMHADGDGVKHDDLRAFEYFRRIADSHADEAPRTPRAVFVANAFVALGNYYLDGIQNSPVKADPDRAREMFTYAASYFGDPDAQYQLGRMYLEGQGGVKDPKQGARWLQLAATNRQYQAQALLGAMLIKGDVVPRQVARGLMWLTLARDSASAQEAWIKELHDRALSEASDEDRATALAFIERWMRGGRRE